MEVTDNYPMTITSDHSIDQGLKYAECQKLHILPETHTSA